MYAGIDMGTSGIKVALMNHEGAIVDSASASLTVESPHPLWNEQDPDSWWAAINNCMEELKKRQDMKKVRSIGLSGQQHGATLLGKDHKVLRPCILWCDGRSYRECAELEKAVPNSREITGNLMMPGFTAGKLLWVKKHEPEIFAKVDKVLLPKDYARFLMTGDFATEMSDASGSMWLNTAKRDWSDEILKATGLSRENMPKLYEGSQITGKLTEEVAARWGMDRVPVVGGGGDNEAGAVGAGLYKPGQAMLSLGTSGVYFIVSDGFKYNTDEAVHSFCHALPKRWHLMSVILSCAVCLDWAAKLTGCKSVGEFVKEAEKARNFDERPIYFLPYLAGERTPHNNPKAKGVFFGLTSHHRRPELARAVLEGVSFAMAQGMDAVHRCNVKPSNIALIGGGSRSPFWRQMLADVSGYPMDYCTGSEVGPALGACRLAQIAMEKRPLEEMLPHLPLKQTHKPDMKKHEVYKKRREIFAALYKQLHPLMDAKL
jgi:xylulokinase